MGEDQEDKNPNFCSEKSLGDFDSSKIGLEAGEQSVGHTLRANPKKRKPSYSINGGSLAEKQCKVCGKSFSTTRALSGHMRHCLSSKEKVKSCCKECGREFGSVKAMFGHMRCHSANKEQSEDEKASTLSHTKRPRSKRYKVSVISHVSDFNAYDDTGIGPEVEEVAMILMMMSKGIRVWGGVDSINESFLGGKSLNRDEARNENGRGFESLVCNGDKGFKNKCDSDDGDVSLGEQVSESADVSYKISKNEEKNAMFGEQVSEFSDLGHLKLENEAKTVELSEFKNPIRNKTRVLDDYEAFDHSRKVEFKCRTCYKIFNSHQSLGGHRARLHRTDKNCILSKTIFSAVETSDKLECSNSNTTENELKKSKEPACTVCFKVFSSGQALGGHMRAHCAGYTDYSDNHDFFDVNILVKFEETVNCREEFEHDLLGGLVSI